MKVTA